MKLDKEILIMEVEAQILGQERSKKVAQAEILKIQSRVEKYEQTIKSLDAEIGKSKKRLAELKGE